MARILIRIDDVTHGPVTPDELRQMAATGRLERHHEVQLDPSSEWMTAEKIGELEFGEAPKEREPPPRPNRPMWNDPPSRSESAVASYKRLGLFLSALAAVGAVLLFCLFLIPRNWNSDHAESVYPKAVIAGLQPILSGSGIASARHPSTGNSRIVVMTPDGHEHEWARSMPDEWRPSRLSDVNWVAVVSQQHTQRVNPSWIGDVVKYFNYASAHQYYVEVKLFSAFDGSLAGETRLLGSKPPHIKPVYSYEIGVDGPSEPISVEGDRVHYAQLETWLRSHTD